MEPFFPIPQAQALPRPCNPTAPTSLCHSSEFTDHSLRDVSHSLLVQKMSVFGQWELPGGVEAAIHVAAETAWANSNAHPITFQRS